MNIKTAQDRTKEKFVGTYLESASPFLSLFRYSLCYFLNKSLEVQVPFYETLNLFLLQLTLLALIPFQFTGLQSRYLLQSFRERIFFFFFFFLPITGSPKNLIEGVRCQGVQVSDFFFFFFK
uniref:Uncharacterized protein n=1 Tax=Cacopsylla melanoneura TaxID=428564 RepID=A0A8D8SRV3_9HEMI